MKICVHTHMEFDRLTQSFNKIKLEIDFQPTESYCKKLKKKNHEASVRQIFSENNLFVILIKICSVWGRE